MSAFIAAVLQKDVTKATTDGTKATVDATNTVAKNLPKSNTTPTKYGNEAFDRSGKRAAYNAQQAKEAEARNARAKEVRQRMIDRAQGKGLPGSGVSPKKMAKGGSVSSASKRADGIASKGKTRGKLV